VLDQDDPVLYPVLAVLIEVFVLYSSDKYRVSKTEHLWPSRWRRRLL